MSLARWAVCGGAAALLWAPVAAAAPPAPPACTDRLADAMTALPDGSFAVCQHGWWQAVAEPFEPGDRWLSYGDGVTLSSQGRRNPEIMAGRWTGTPLSGGGCGAEQTPVTDAGLAAPVKTGGADGEPLAFEIGPTVFTVTLTGNCLWEPASPPPSADS